MEPAHTSVGVMAPVRISRPRNSRAHQLVFTILNYALKETGVIDRAAAWFISRRIAKGRPLVFLGLFFLSNLMPSACLWSVSLAMHLCRVGHWRD